MGNHVPLRNLKEIFHIEGDGGNLTRRSLHGTFLMVHSKYVVET